MQRGVGGGEFEPVDERPDREVTLGPVMLLGIFFGLILLCGLFFGLGYAAGRRGAAQPAAAGTQPPAGVPMPVAAGGSAAKPAATVPNPYQPQPPAATTPEDASAVEGNVVGSPQDAGTVSPAGAAVSQPQVRPALPQQASGSQAIGAPSAGAPVQATTAQTSAWMVQVAALSHVEDASALVNALRKHGYAVTARREAADGMIHVQVGPFVNRNDANAMSQRLLSDGYNAIVLP